MERLEGDLPGARGQPLDPLGEIVDRDRGARVADVEALADRARMLEREQRAVDHVVHVAPGSNLRPVPVDREIPPRERGLDERADRAAADLPRPEDVERANGGRGKPELGVVGVRHVLARELRHRVRPARLAHGADRRDVRLLHVERVLAEHLARREVHQALDRVSAAERRLEHVVGADDVDAHRPHRALENGVDAGDPRAVDDVRRSGKSSSKALGVEDVPLHEVEVRVLGEARPAERVAVQVVDGDDLVRVDQPARERRADEPCAAGDDDPLAAQGHAASLVAGVYASR